mmetsp:Transcript_87302/g.246262  ORF Transcript_87302/g.246262 Transcript_87302/m.246262 type:complete len:315 (+) Transcript_87302:224-1168(+)
MRPGAAAGSTFSPLSPESRALERSLYLNLAQGYLKMGEAVRALRACQVVMHENPDDAKAKYRGAEACLALRRFDDAEQLLQGVAEASDDPATAAGVGRLLQRVRAGQKEDARRQREVGKRMGAAATGFSEGRQPQGGTSAAYAAKSANVNAHFAALDPDAIAVATDVADEAAKAAQRREERLAAGPPLPSPVVHDLDAFRAKIAARTSKYAAHADKCRRKREVVQHSVKLDWLREGKTRSEFSDFEQKWREELEQTEREAHAEARAAAAAAEAEEAEVDADADASGGGGGDGERGAAPAEAEAEAEAGSFGEMD